MKIKALWIFLLVAGLVSISPCVFSQDTEEQITLRTLSVEWYMESTQGVKICYRTFKNEPAYLYLPKSFHGKYYRFVSAPRESSSMGLPALIVRMKDQEVVFIDIYTRYQSPNARAGDFTKKDLEQFKEADQRGKPRIKF
ncbi:MAG: hypothetical protein ACOC7U_06440 [Spirochaetota bacterium]